MLRKLIHPILVLPFCLYINSQEVLLSKANNNIEEIDPLGDKFDPNFHEALSIKEDKSKQVEEVLEVIQKGYKIQERVIRPALVIVNKI